MQLIFFADLILILHFIIVIFVTGLFFLIPLGYKLNWCWQRNKKIRLFHLGLILLVTIETVLGITCPLTIIENNLRGIITSNSFIAIWITRLLFWNFSKEFFILVYFLCLIWTTIMWKKFPPNESKKN